MISIPTFIDISQTVEPLLGKLLSPVKLGWVANKFPKLINRLVVQQVINSVLSEQIAEGDFDFLEHRMLQIEISDAVVFIVLSFSEQQIICTHFDNKPNQSDATLSIDSTNAIQLIQQEVDPDTLFFQRKLKIKGDTELAHHVKNTLDTIDPDVIPTFLLTIFHQYQQQVLNKL